MKWLNFPESLYVVNLYNDKILGDLSHVAFDAARLADVETFVLGNVEGTDWEVSSIEKNYYQFATILGGPNGEMIDFQLHSGLKQIDTLRIDQLDIYDEATGITDCDWFEILASSIRLNNPATRYNKKV